MGPGRVVRRKLCICIFFVIYTAWSSSDGFRKSLTWDLYGSVFSWKRVVDRAVCGCQERTGSDVAGASWTGFFACECEFDGIFCSHAGVLGKIVRDRGVMIHALTLQCDVRGSADTTSSVSYSCLQSLSRSLYYTRDTVGKVPFGATSTGPESSKMCSYSSGYAHAQSGSLGRASCCQPSPPLQAQIDAPPRFNTAPQPARVPAQPFVFAPSSSYFPVPLPTPPPAPGSWTRRPHPPPPPRPV